MAAFIVTLNGTFVRKVLITQPRLTIGRRGSNDVVLDSATVDAVHALFFVEDQASYLEDLNSAGGTTVNGFAIGKQELKDGDQVQVGKFLLTYLENADGRTSAWPELQREQRPKPPDIRGRPVLMILSGPTAGRSLLLDKPVTRIGKKGVGIARLTRVAQGSYTISYESGPYVPLVNGNLVGEGEEVMLLDEDIIEWAVGTELHVKARVAKERRSVQRS